MTGNIHNRNVRFYKEKEADRLMGMMCPAYGVFL